jgi:uncharacterized protein YuzE
MNLHLDKQADALYVRLDPAIVLESEEVAPGVILDFSPEGQVVGIEILGLSARSPSHDLQQLVIRSAGFAAASVVCEDTPPYGQPPSSREP